MRIVARRRGCPYAVTEALLDVIMLSGGQGLKKSIDINEEDHPVAGQVIGSEPAEMARAAGILAANGYDVIDLNFACPVKKIKNKARGGHMLLDTDRAIAVLRAVRELVPANVPTTISLRRGFDDRPEAEDAFHRIVETAWSLGYSAVRVHARTVEQKYLGRADWSVLKKIKQHYPNRTILGSGDVFTAEDAVRMLKETGVDLVWIARGAIGNPWIFRQAQVLLEHEVGSGFRVQGSGRKDEGGRMKDEEDEISLASGPLSVVRCQLPVASTTDNGQRTTDNEQTRNSAGQLATRNLLSPPTLGEQRFALEEHFGLAMQIHGESMAGRRMRKMGIKYSRFHPESARVKSEFINVTSLRDWKRVLDAWYAADGPGVWPAADAANEVNPASDASCDAAA